ncbi:hypothetical protein [Corynebacterium pygosceleis]|uniref:Uncharacterized protein n=1 Tax=Corynebacterium pygosceleis TaxID=2800406 RepID=A0A9Q4C7N3_9CORY|nr:hypothetical protein [Corynebacterium pygosceleis]MCK7637459.1 hypothetical protein [Corynebacterium pygosceleis]MCK7674646.1 hypothetical protein [Corynebacterium pygosceleis]MCL0119765.1 hypothetical protein [Corynebacterium pygosceleis]MCX7445012.1 hypothetical protein [Corynebacterium pygosceleis]MCX7468212.1 hypothetical protein [Corynebacterium pygosceleis]
MSLLHVSATGPFRSTVGRVLNWLRPAPAPVPAPLTVLAEPLRVRELLHGDEDIFVWYLIDAGMTPATREDIELAWVIHHGLRPSEETVSYLRESVLEPLGLNAG